MSKKESLVPSLRFEGFAGDWPKKRLGQLFNIKAGGDIDAKHVSQERTDQYQYPIYANARKDKGFYAYSDIFKANDGTVTVAGRGVHIGIAHARDHKFYPIVRLLVLSPLHNEDIYFSELAINRIRLFIESTGVPQLTSPQLSGYSIRIPSLPEQQKIADFLTAVDGRIGQLIQKKALLEDYKKGVMQQIFTQAIRFKDDHGNDFPDWGEMEFTEVMKTVSPRGFQIESSAILSVGEYRVIDQGKAKIAGYSNDSDKVVGEVPVIVFGDHTTVIKYIDFEFIVGADGTKILISKNRDHDLRYLYYNLVHNNVSQEGYKRHFSILKEISMQVPSPEEQTKIANFLSAIDRKIESVATQITETQTFKRGLLQQMFV
ncbi:MAG: restriction endonuclease subunit S [Pseudomonadales bacterium]|nr:restriction endonuclease subunit S [Pseudomonadales bacterium]